MRRYRKPLLAGGVLGAIGFVLARRRSRRTNPIDPALLDKARSWVSDQALPEHVRDVARKVIDLGETQGRDIATRASRRRGR